MDTTETTIYNAVILASFISGIFALIFLGISLWTQRKHQEKNRQQVASEVMALEADRRRVSADLHDDLGPLMFAIRRKLENVKTADDESMEKIREALSYLGKLNLNMRIISRGLMPLSLQEKGLTYALQEYITQINFETNLQINCCVDALPLLTGAQETHVYRILQEIIQNTIKHAGASMLRLHIRNEKGQLHIATADDGRGFDYKKVSLLKSGSGLVNIKNRVHFLKGRMNIFSQAGLGCKYEIIIGTWIPFIYSVSIIL
jgi:signal transduction histidine kinase